MSDVSRREFLESTAAAVTVAAARPALPAGLDAVTQTDAIVRTATTLTVNGREYRVEIEDRSTLAEAIRDQLGLTGTKIGCDRGECGACTVLLDGSPIYACSYLAVWANGRRVETVEGLARGGELDPLQKSFVEHDAPQCGFCTSGQLMSAKALLAVNPHPSADQVRSALTGNLCRCSNYNHYVRAVVAAGAARPGPPVPAGLSEEQP
jgi:aerobic-type carbon monoxide dehydrogenase small subunit (CoxS/CutS family)